MQPLAKEECIHEQGTHHQTYHDYHTISINLATYFIIQMRLQQRKVGETSRYDTSGRPDNCITNITQYSIVPDAVAQHKHLPQHNSIVTPVEISYLCNGPLTSSDSLVQTVSAYTRYTNTIKYKTLIRLSNQVKLINQQ